MFPFLQTVSQRTLDNIVPFAYTAMFLIPLGGVLVLCAMQLGPETRDVDLLAHEPPAVETAPPGATSPRPVPAGRVATR